MGFGMAIFEVKVNIFQIAYMHDMDFMKWFSSKYVYFNLVNVPNVRIFRVIVWTIHLRWTKALILFPYLHSWN